MAFGNHRQDQEAMSEINVTPLVDVMLVLLVVFIVTAPLLTQSVGVTLPKTVAAAPPPETQVTLVSIDAAGQVYLDQAKIDEEGLGRELEALKSREPERIVQFEIDEQVVYGKAAAVLAIAQHAGIAKISLRTRP